MWKVNFLCASALVMLWYSDIDDTDVTVDRCKGGSFRH